MNFVNPVYAPPLAAATLRRTSSGTNNRKRSLTGHVVDASRLSYASRKSESDKDMLGPLVPVGVAFMEQVTLDIAVAKETHSDARYVLGVRHLKSNASWSHARSFDDYRRFQHRLLKALDHGHFCSAECPWLYTFLKSYFPKKHLFQFVSSRVVASRKDALERFFVSLQNFLLNRANHSCSFIGTQVVDVVVDFVYGDYAKYYQMDGAADYQRDGSFCNNQGTVSKAPRGPESSACPEDDEASTASATSSTNPMMLQCQLCESSLEGEAYASSRSYASIATTVSSGLPSTASSNSLMSDDSPMDTSDIRSISASAPTTSSALSSAMLSRQRTHYVMTLGCGHQFHDECIVPKLNETLRCPTCDHLEVK